MDIIVEDKAFSFKDLEREIFRMICEKGVELTREILKSLDQKIFNDIDKELYRSEGFRKTSVKTQYGEVEYSRRVYRTMTEDGQKAFVYLLDEVIGMKRIGLISENLAEIIADAATEEPYRKASGSVSTMTGSSISAQGAWDVIQKVGERIDEEEAYAVNQMNTYQSRGKKAIPVLFEEMDGVWIRQQGSHHEKKPMQEVKVATTYEGWDANKESMNRSTLTGKHVIAGIENARIFHEKREADIQSRYDVDEIIQRVVNGDGGSWIGEPNDPEAIIQLDPFHVHKEIRRLIADKDAINEIERRYTEKDIAGMLDYVRTYAVSVASDDAADKRAKNAQALLKYLTNNKDALLPWQERGIKIPEAPAGITYKAMGVQENQNCTVVTLRMKHRRMRWSPDGGNNMAKALARRENHELHSTITRYSDALIFGKEITRAIEVLSAAKAPKKDGKGSPYPDIFGRHVPLLDAAVTWGRQVFWNIVSGKGTM